jgi:hypothetical protein
MPKGSGESKREGKGQSNEILPRRRANNNTDASNEMNVDENSVERSVEGRNDHGGNQGHNTQDTRDVLTHSFARNLSIGQDTRDVLAHSFARNSTIGQDTRDVAAFSFPRSSNIERDTVFTRNSNIKQDTHGVSAHSHPSALAHDVPARYSQDFAHFSDNMQSAHGTYAEEPVLYGTADYGGDEDDYSAADETIMPDKGKGREVDNEQGPATQSILSGIKLQPFRPRVADYDPILDYKLNVLPRYQDDTSERGRAFVATQGMAVPSDPDSIMSFYHSSRSVKRDREAESDESRQSKIHRHSTSHSTAASAEHSVGQSVPPTRAVSHMSQNEDSDSDLHGASRTTGGVFRGKAIGNVMNWADAGMYFSYTQFFSNVQIFFFFRYYGCRHRSPSATYWQGVVIYWPRKGYSSCYDHETSDYW